MVEAGFGADGQTQTYAAFIQTCRITPEAVLRYARLKALFPAQYETAEVWLLSGDNVKKVLLTFGNEPADRPDLHLQCGLEWDFENAQCCYHPNEIRNAVSELLTGFI